MPSLDPSFHARVRANTYPCFASLHLSHLGICHYGLIAEFHDWRFFVRAFSQGATPLQHESITLIGDPVSPMALPTTASAHTCVSVAPKCVLQAEETLIIVQIRYASINKTFDTFNATRLRGFVKWSPPVRVWLAQRESPAGTTSLLFDVSSEALVC